MGFIRAPARFAFLIAFSLSIISAFGVKEILKKFNNQKIILTIIISLLVLFESFPLSNVSIEEATTPQIYFWLRDQDVKALVELPIYLDSSASNHIKNANYILYSTAHWKNMLNSYSDRSPKEYYRLISEVRSFPSISTLCYLKKFNTSHIIVHASDIKDHYGTNMEEILKNKDLEFLKQEDDIYIFKVKEISC